ncbi:uncharacterized protein MONOS_1073 [Monocercomonoides exilis]|uniref:uncharacterized protein n=1 Tax=Monocercomonoides exilis TaxID=2049356 RepID=UPI003559730F|nr:hypothetical protein MONOS_1073 [Monocercomonoides exilis]|eukprot:MONOS_1073.1-p1 / transcript=MONOS_1073.1 / gene=MONOS_1073 / organism=Monocercomonoides_exilis_PA203 / gene_product=unspecified product / transcript_product=unspecified product / location=Mono_scaffold00018:96551-97072(-) / protein_length=174 / sequence_SO=supercontig / SO=protein_coding / is_pseudo=false
MQLFVYYTNDIAVELPLLRLPFTTSPCIDSPLVQLHSYLTPTNISPVAVTATIEAHPHSSHHCGMLDYFLYVPEESMDKYVSNTEEFEKIVQRHLNRISAVPVSSSASSSEQYPQRTIFSFVEAMQIVNTYTPTKRLPGLEGSYSASSIEDKTQNEILCTLFAILCSTMQSLS